MSHESLMVFQLKDGSLRPVAVRAAWNMNKPCTLHIGSRSSKVSGRRHGSNFRGTTSCTYSVCGVCLFSKKEETTSN